MKKLQVLVLGLAILFGASFVVSSCAVVPSPVGPVGLFVDVTAPMPATTTLLNATSFTKTGKAEATNILGLIQTGDCSITEAMKAGGITRVHHVDMQITNVLMLYAKKITIVYGE